jgi:hypothetical protein
LPTAPPAPVDADSFLARWRSSGAAGRANYQLFLSELCDLLAVPRPDPARPGDRDNAYVFERLVRFDDGDGSHSTGRIDLYQRGGFVLEAKQGSAATDPAQPLLLPVEPTARRKKGTAVRGSTARDRAPRVRKARQRVPAEQSLGL